MVIARNIWRQKDYIGNLALKRIAHTPNDYAKNTASSFEYTNKILKLITKYKALIAMASLLIFQFALYDFSYAEYAAL
ncbi:MAG: hypothetical protein Tsb006_7930 [Rickettsiaceae bacterium]